MKRAVAFDHPHAETGEALLGIVRRDRGDDVVDMLVDLGEVDLGAPARRRRTASRLRDRSCARLAGRDQRLRRHAAGIEAFAAHLALFDQHDRHAERGGGRRDRQAAGAGADDADVGGEQFGHALSCTLFESAGAGGRRAPRSRFTTTGISASTPSAASAARSSGVTAVLQMEIEPAVGASGRRHRR